MVADRPMNTASATATVRMNMLVSLRTPLSTTDRHDEDIFIHELDLHVHNYATRDSDATDILTDH